MSASSNFNLAKPPLMNTLFKKYGGHSMPFIDSIVMPTIKWKIESKRDEELKKILAEIPMKKQVRATLKRNITNQYKKMRNRLASYEKKNGLVVADNPAIFKHYEQEWGK